MSAPHLCFYSAKDRYSSAFLEELARSPYVKEFRFICVDVNAAGVRPALPPYVRAVPTLMIAGEPEPRVDAAVMNWLSERRLHDRSSVSTMGPAGARAPPGGRAEPAGPMAWGGSDMMGGGGDEGFAYLDDNTAPSDKGTVRLAGNMASFHDIGAMVAPDSRTVPGGIMAATAGAGAGAGAGTSEKSRALSSAYEAALAARSRDVPGPVQRIGSGGGGFSMR
jgi:hypothetical protein